MNTLRNTAAALLLALAGWLAVPTPPTAADTEPARCAGAVAVAYAALAPQVTPPAPPTPPAPEAPCGGKCSNGTFKPDGRIPMECPKDCPCGCRRAKAATKCSACLDNKYIMATDGVIRPCRSCCPDGKCPLR